MEIEYKGANAVTLKAGQATLVINPKLSADIKDRFVSEVLGSPHRIAFDSNNIIKPSDKTVTD